MSAAQVPYQHAPEWHAKMLALEIAAKAVAGNCHNQHAEQIAEKTQKVADILYKDYIRKL